jgi:hypothetical protein
MRLLKRANAGLAGEEAAGGGAHLRQAKRVAA